MKKLPTFFFLLFLIVSRASGVTYLSAGNGNWNTASTWSPSGIPSAGDIVTIRNGHSVTVTANAVCSSLTISGGSTVSASSLTINGNYSLTVNGNVTLNSTLSLVGSASVNVLGTLAVNGNLLLNHASTALTYSNSVQVGSSSTSGLLSVTGSTTLQNSLVVGLGTANRLTLNRGLMDFDGNVSFSSGTSGLSHTNVINADDNTSNDAKSKTIMFAGNFSGIASGSLTLTDSDGDAPYDFTFNGTGTQYLTTTNCTYKNIVVDNNYAELQLSSNPDNTQIKGRITLKNRSVLNVKQYNLNTLNSQTSQILLESGSKLIVENESGVPTTKINNIAVAVADANSTIEYRSDVAMHVFDKDFDFPHVILSGVGDKNYLSDKIDNSTIKVNSITIAEGSFLLAKNEKLKLNPASTKKLTVKNGAVLKILGDFREMDAWFEFERNSTVWYQDNMFQTVYSFEQAAGVKAPYGNLRLETYNFATGGVRNVLEGVTVQVRGKVSFGTGITLNLAASSALELLSDATSTGYIGEIPSNVVINYNGSPAGKVIANRLIPLPNKNYRDLSSPIQGTTLQSWKSAGLLFTGFTGSDYPNYSYVNAYQYNEAATGDLNDGFVAAGNITNSLVTFNGSGQVTRSGWKVYTGETNNTAFSKTFRDQGQINRGPVSVLCTFTAGVTGNRAANDGWNMVGNPFPAPVNWNKVYRNSANTGVFGSTGILPICYIYEPYDLGNPVNKAEGYGFYNAATGVGNNLDSIIPSFQAFWVKTYHASASSQSYVLRLSESDKEDNSSSKFYKSDINLSLVKLSLKGNVSSDAIWFHPWENATTGEDPGFDIPRFGTSATAATISFGTGQGPLDLWVNALPDHADNMEIPLYITNPKGESLTISFSNLEYFTGSFGCVILHDLVENKSVPAESPYSFTTPAGFAGQRFVLIIRKTVENKITYQDAFCYESNDGLLQLDLRSFTESSAFSLFRDGQEVMQIAGPPSIVRVPLGRGEYTLVSNTGYIGCGTSSYSFSIASLPEVVADFEAPQSVFTNTALNFFNTSAGSSAYLWNMGDGTPERTGTHIGYSYASPGTYTVMLTAMNNYDCETSVITKKIEVLSATGIEDLDKSGEIRILTEEGGLVLSAPAGSASDVMIFDLQGKLVANCPSAATGTVLYDGSLNKVLVIYLRVDGRSFRKTLYY